MRTLALAALLAFAGEYGLAQDQDSTPITIPLKGLVGACCEKPVEQALAKMENVSSVTLGKSGSVYQASVVMRIGFGLPMSDVKKALNAANRQMGDQMGTKYEMDDSLSLAYVHLFKVKTEPEEGALKESLAKLPGYKSSWKYKEGFGVAFEGAKQPAVSEIVKASRLEMIDLVLGPSKGGARYFCPMHPERTAATASSCPSCRMKMIEVPASSPQQLGNDLAPGKKEAPEAKVGKYVCSMDGGQRDNPGACPKCGMKLGERDFVAAGGTNALSTKPAGKYVCSMDGGTRDTPGKCPKCAMTLTERNYVAPGARGPSTRGRGGSC